MKSIVTFAMCCLVAYCGLAAYIDETVLDQYDWSAYRIASRPSVISGAADGITLSWGATIKTSKVEGQTQASVQGVVNGTFVIFRNGVAIATVHDAGGYTDMEVDAGQTYSYYIVGTAPWPYNSYTSTSPTNPNCTCYRNYLISATDEVGIDGSGGSQSINVNVYHQTYEKSGGKYELNTESSSTWTVDCNAAWLSCSKLESGDAIGIIVEPNTTGEARSADVMILAGNGTCRTQRIRVTQNAFDGVVITTPEDKHVAIPSAWAGNYPAFTEKFGSNLSSALQSSTGKKDRDGNAMLVWHDFVAGTDPTKKDDLFAAKIDMQNGAPVVTWEPNLNTNGEVRLYKVYGKETLSSAEEWAYPTNSLHRFFKVTVEMP